MEQTCSSFVLDEYIGFLTINNIKDIMKYRNEIDLSISYGTIVSLAIICNDDNGSNESDMTIEQKTDLYKWIRLLPVITVAIVTDFCASMTELIMNCDIRLCGENSEIKFQEYQGENKKVFIEQCQLLMGKYRDKAEYEKLICSKITANEAIKLRFVNRIIDTANVNEAIKEYLNSILADKSANQIKAIINCFNSYKLYGINSYKELLLEEEARQFCLLIKGESRLPNEN